MAFYYKNIAKNPYFSKRDGASKYLFEFYPFLDILDRINVGKLSVEGKEHI